MRSHDNEAPGKSGQSAEILRYHGYILRIRIMHATTNKKPSRRLDSVAGLDEFSAVCEHYQPGVIAVSLWSIGYSPEMSSMCQDMPERGMPTPVEKRCYV